MSSTSFSTPDGRGGEDEDVRTSAGFRADLDDLVLEDGVESEFFSQVEDKFVTGGSADGVGLGEVGERSNILARDWGFVELRDVLDG